MNRREFLKTTALAGALAGVAGILPHILSAEEGKYNVLFIAVDDLRTQLGCYGCPTAKTPNIDALAASGMQFNHAYCQQALCTPSRTSLLTGRRPDTTKVYNLGTHFRKNIPDTIALPEQFKLHGYFTQGLSKIYHPGVDDPQSWSVPHWDPKIPGYGDPENLKAIADEKAALQKAGTYSPKKVLEKDPKTGLPLEVQRATRVKGPPWEAPDVPDNALPDGATADKAIETLNQLKDKRFFLGVGFLKPHLPFVAPKKYYDLFADTKFKLADNPLPPKDCPEVATYNWGELRGYTGMPKEGPVPDEDALKLIKAYHAASAYTDAQVGRVIGELERLGLRDKTIIVLFGDHGWQLGEHGHWCKHTNFEEATHAPLIISVPGMKNKGKKSESLVEFVDIYPTLCDLAGLPKPKELEGTSLVPIMNDPKRKLKKAAFSQYPRPNKVMGHSMRTERYRYTEWAVPGEAPVGIELYDYQTDPEGNVNIAGKPENKELVANMSKALHDGWKSALL